MSAPETRQDELGSLLRHTFVASFEHHAQIGSTNDRAAHCATERRYELPLLILADEQTAGRGRGANRWWTGPSSLAFSLLMAPEQVGADARGRSPLAALAAAIAVAETAAPLLPEQTVGIHWPNDVMAAGRKLSGILVEVLPDGRHIVGIGVNTNNSFADAPEELRPRVASLRDLAGHTFHRAEILVALLRSLEAQFRHLVSDARQVAAAADTLCLQRDRILTIDQGTQAIRGRCRGIAMDGGLLLETPGGIRTLYSGVVAGSPENSASPPKAR